MAEGSRTRVNTTFAPLHHDRTIAPRSTHNGEEAILPSHEDGSITIQAPPAAPDAATAPAASSPSKDKEYESSTGRDTPSDAVSLEMPALGETTGEGDGDQPTDEAVRLYNAAAAEVKPSSFSNTGLFFGFEEDAVEVAYQASLAEDRWHPVNRIEPVPTRMCFGTWH